MESWKEVRPSCSVGLLLRAALLAAKNCVRRLRILLLALRCEGNAAWPVALLSKIWQLLT